MLVGDRHLEIVHRICRKVHAEAPEIEGTESWTFRSSITKGNGGGPTPRLSGTENRCLRNVPVDWIQRSSFLESSEYGFNSLLLYRLELFVASDKSDELLLRETCSCSGTSTLSFIAEDEAFRSFSYFRRSRRLHLHSVSGCRSVAVVSIKMFLHYAFKYSERI